MTKEDKEQLLRDLCARLPYGVKGLITYNGDKDIFIVKGIFNDILSLSDTECCHVEDFRPYLFPLSSMTEEEKEEYCRLQQRIIYNSKGVVNEDATKYIRWCYKKHLDINNLIPIGLAIDATNLSIY